MTLKEQDKHCSKHKEHIVVKVSALKSWPRPKIGRTLHVMCYVQIVSLLQSSSSSFAESDGWHFFLHWIILIRVGFTEDFITLLSSLKLCVGKYELLISICWKIVKQGKNIWETYIMYKNITSWLSNLSKGGTFTTWSRVWLRRIWQANELFLRSKIKK